MQGTKDKVIVITGASSGIGEATAVMLAERGAKVVLGARGLERLEGLARRIAGAGGEVAYAQTDVRKREDVTSLVNLLPPIPSRQSLGEKLVCQRCHWHTPPLGFMVKNRHEETIDGRAVVLRSHTLLVEVKKEFSTR